MIITLPITGYGFHCMEVVVRGNGEVKLWYRFYPEAPDAP